MVSCGMRIDVLTLFPEMFSGPLNASILGRAQANEIIQVHVWNIRDYALDKHRVWMILPTVGEQVWCSNPMWLCELSKM